MPLHKVTNSSSCTILYFMHLTHALHMRDIFSTQVGWLFWNIFHLFNSNLSSAISSETVPQCSAQHDTASTTCKTNSNVQQQDPACAFCQVFAFFSLNCQFWSQILSFAFLNKKVHRVFKKKGFSMLFHESKEEKKHKNQRFMKNLYTQTFCHQLDLVKVKLCLWNKTKAPYSFWIKKMLE